MFTKIFFKLFPPPKYLNIPYAGLDISDDAVSCVEYTNNSHGYTLHRYGYRLLKPGVIESGNIKDEKALVQEISSLVQELKITTVKASLPEERMYLFKTQVPDTNEDQIRQNVEFKLEENVPLSTAESIFFFDRLPEPAPKGETYVSVSVAPKDLVDSYLKALQTSGLNVVSFEIQAKAIARSIVPHGSTETKLIVHIMNKKTGLYVVSSGVVCFTSTIPWGGELVRGKKVTDIADDIFTLKNEIEKVYNYWLEHGGTQTIKSIIISGRDAVNVSQITGLSPDPKIQVSVANVWQNAFSLNHYVPKITFEDSLDFATAAGLALP